MAQVPPSRPSRRKRILYAEDDPDSREVLCILLSDYEVSTARTIEQAWEKARSGQFDLYVLDGRFEDGSGIQLCRQLRAFDPITPIMFFTGEAGRCFISEARDAGAQICLVKPYDFESLLPTTEHLLNGWFVAKG